MSSAQLLKKYFWMLRAFQSGPISKQEIDARWARATLNDEHKTSIPKSTFYHMKNEVEELFNVDIEVNENGEFYVVESASMDKDFHQWLLSGLAIGNTLNECENIHSRIMYEKIPGGTQYLHTIADAMQNNCRVIIRYGSFKHEPREFIFSPYAIRVYKQRWYAIGHSSDHPEDVARVYAFDRFMQVSLTSAHFTVPANFSVEKFFHDCYGVTPGKPEDVVDITVRIAHAGVQYLRTLPLHHSQREVNTTPEYSDFQFHLAPNFEFTQEILSRGAEAEVLAPESYRQQIAQTIAALNAKYNN